MLLHIGPRGWGKDWEAVLTEIEKGINVEDGSPEARLVRELGQAIRQLRFGMIAVRIDGGLGLNVITLFDDEGAARKVLTQLAGGPKPSDLNGLPRGNVLAVQAAQGDGEQNIAIARAMMELALRNSSLTKPFISAAHRPNFVGS